ncbi:putative Ig domain-containing protein [Ureibacillus xyleni]|uniref:Putative Ig domain-containing protein n=1 Tax=Ureibacillus xyleni TaxID=614648 RepID=A0A285R982_9BACL|nr:LamG-like jellyroll fold domain-containing protein [Ureibacillus xyleni]SOB90269.1 putative Ig domain-containing protein [Ureibacillus xyleni]
MDTILTGTYVYSDINGDVEGTSTFRWYADGVAISGATANTYTLTVAEVGKTIEFGVTPVNAKASGIEVKSAATAVVVAPPIVIPSIINPMFQNLTYNGTVAKTSGGLGPVTYQVTTGILPNGLTLNPFTGAITGKPTVTGAYNFTITATDSSPVPLTKVQQYVGTITNPLVLHLTFDGTTNDSSGYGNHGTIIHQENVVYDGGVIGNAIKFGGVRATGSVKVEQNSSLALNNEVTLAYWLRMDSHYGEYNSDGNYIAKGNHAVFVKGNEGRLSSYIYTGAHKADLWYQRSPGNKTIMVTNPFTVGDWVHVAFTISPTQQKGYINGVEVSTGNLIVPADLTTSNNPAEPIYIGWLNEQYYALNGAVDDLRMYNKALSASDISVLYQLRN